MKIKKYFTQAVNTTFTASIISLIFINSSFGSTTATKIPVSLADEPLHAAGTMDKPAITLALSVEFPTIGALYRDGNKDIDESYSPNNEYIGYFYSKGCYEYISNPTDTLSAGETANDYKRFKFVEESENRQCTGEKFSGNFLNWAASSSIDILRLALSGGDRYIDKNGLTILQRAVVPAGNPVVACLWNHTMFFPGKKLAYGNFAGAIPTSLATKVGNNDLWVASKHNGIYFNKYPKNSTTTPVRRGWNESSCNISSEVTDYSNFLKNSPAPTNSDGFYYARVEVCTKSADGTVKDHKDFGLCTEQPNGNFKPTGVIQKYSNNLRMASFSYLLDHSADRYGGVLRTPMRYLGPKSYDIYGREESTPNIHAEWEPTTGIFIKNPSPVTGFNNSGLINYLNKFGRMGPKVATGSSTTTDTSNHYYGEYKFRDPFSTLYQQALRYLQGLPPNSESTTGLNNNTSKFYDGFPIYTDWSNLDPYGGGRSSAENFSCLKSNIVAIGDIFFNEKSSITPTNDPNSRKINYATWRNNALRYDVSNFSNNKITVPATGSGAVSARPRDNPNGNSANTDDYNIVGYAYWAHANDIRGTDWTEEATKSADLNKQRPGLRVKSFFFDVNEKGMSPTNRLYNPFYLAAKYGGYENEPGNQQKNYYSVDEKPNKGYSPYDKGTPKTLVTKDAIWQRRPIEERDATNSSIYDPATYYLQSDARSVLNAFENIFAQASNQAQSISQSSTSSSTVKASSDNYVYTGIYDTGSWEGNVEAHQIVVDSNSKNISLKHDTTWNPSARLLAKNPNQRNILIGSSTRKSAMNFTWAALDTTTKSHLNKPSISSSADTLGEKRLNYLRGSRSESDEFRVRTSLLGDIINSGVTYSGPPSNKFTDKSYRLFYEQNKNRLPIVIAGANDGMLHAFAAKATTGIAAADEVFAYIPSWLAPKLSSLVNRDYVDEGNHQSFVDAPSVVGEAQVTFTAGDGSASDWKTVLVSGTGAGGRGVFALDITNPTSFSTSNFIWEFTQADDLDMGYVVSAPKILKFKTGVDARGKETYRWFAAVASGVNNYQSTYESGGGSGSPSIFLLALDKPPSSSWTLNNNYYKISFPFSTTLAATMAPGIIDFSMLYGKNNEVTHIYAGDLQGNLWKLDFTDDNTTSKFKPPSSWNANQLSYFKNGSGEALPLYIAQTGGNSPVRQPISAAPLLVTGPVVKGIESFYVVLGTGKYLELTDTSSANTRTESVYVLYDDNDSSLDSSGAASAISGRGRLRAATLNTQAKTISVSNFVWGRASSDSDSTKRSGWYFDFPENAERMINKAENLGQFNISLNSIIPAQPQTTPSICTIDTASSNVYDINIKSGGGQYKVSDIGILGPSLFLENEEKTEVSAVDSTGRAKRTIVQERILIGTKGHNVDQSMKINEFVGRLSWRQIYNFKELQRSSSGSSGSSSPATKP